jgi:hypothetical protein
MSATILSPAPTATPLTALDRCDRCIAAAQVRVVLTNGFDLILCQHHANKYEAGLAPLTASVEQKAVSE